MNRKTIAVVAGLGVPALTVGTDFTGALMLVLPIERKFAADITTTQWVLNIYALTFAMGMVTAGRLADMFGRRRLLLIGLTVFIIGSLGCAAAPSMALLITARAVQGIGSSIIWPCLLGIASTSVQKDEQGFAIGMIMGIVTFGNVIGPIFAGIVGGMGHWRLFYTANVVLGVLSAVIVPRVVPADAIHRRDEGIDYGGIIVLSLAILGLLYALDVGADWGWSSLPVIGLLATAAILFGAFPPVENRVAIPLVPRQMRRNSHFLLALLANGLCVPSVFLLFLYIPQYLNKVLDWPILTASIGALPLMASLSAMSLLSGHLYNRIGPRRLLVGGYCLTAAGSLAVLLISPEWGYSGLLPAMLLVGIGGGLCVGPAGSAAVGAADPSRASLAGALSFMVHLSLGAIGVAGGTAILYGLSASKLQQGVAALDVSLSAADRLALNSAAPGAAASREILARFSTPVADQITAAIRDAFAFGLHQAYWLPSAMAVIGIFVALALDDRKLAQTDG
jgi:DHA2 family methylenomycin A resistance protein-like MFS transporter